MIIETIADWYIKIFRVIVYLLFLVSLAMIYLGIVEEQYWLFLGLPLLILYAGNMAIFILMYQHLESIDSKRL